MNSEQVTKPASDKVFEILIVDDEQDVLDALMNTLKRAKEMRCEIMTANDGNAALNILNTHEFDLVISDYKMPEMNGIQLLSKVREMYPQTLRFLVTGYSDINVAKEAINTAQVHHYVEKPWDNEALRSTILDALTKKVERDNEKPTRTNNVQEALKLITEAQSKSIIGKGGSIGKNIMMIEFPNAAEFNMFSNEIRKKTNVVIEDIQIYGSKYVITVRFYPGSFQVIK